LAEANNCSGAIAEFNASMAILPRASTLFNIARCQETLNRYDLALQAYERYLEFADADATERATVVATMRQMRTLLGTIHVVTNVPAEVWLDDRVVGSAPGDVLVPGGRHVLELRARGRLPEQREVEVMARGAISIEVELRASQSVTNVNVESPPLPAALTLTMLGASVAAVGVGVGFGVNALMLSDEENARDSRLPRDGAAIDESALFADIFFISGGVLAAATLAFGFLTDWGGDAASSGAVTVRPLVGPTLVGLRLEGQL